MTHHRTMWAQVSLLAVSGACLPEPPTPETQAMTSVLGYSIRDPAGSSWPAQGAPRLPRLEVALTGVLENAAARVWLLRGVPDSDLLADLLDPPLRATTEARVVAIGIDARGTHVIVSPLKALEPRERYSLVVAANTEEPFVETFEISDSPFAGARWVQSWPADQSRGVPLNLKASLLRFDGHLAADAAERIALSSGGKTLDAEIEVEACDALGLAPGDCVWLRPQAPLPAQAELELAIAGVHDATGAPLDAVTVRFVTGESADEHAPSPAPIPCAIDEQDLQGAGCALSSERSVSVRVQVDEPTLVTLQLGPARTAALSVAGDAVLDLVGLEPDAEHSAVLSLLDAAGATRAFPLSLRTTVPLASLSIDEVRLDPLGPEPEQEYVELLNFGTRPIQIMGFSLSDDAFEAGVTIAQAIEVVPQERVLVVGPGFDPEDTSDGSLPGGVRTARTDRTLSVRNSGAPLYLRDAQGRRLSASPSMTGSEAGACIARKSADPRSGSFAAFAPDPNGSCTPGTATGWP